MRKASRPARVLLALVTALSLGFGAATAFAAPGTARSAIIGTCTSQQDCQDKCVLAGGYEGICDIKGRCHCAF